MAALLRRADQRRGAGRLRVGELEIDPASRTVLLHGQALALSQKEFALLRTLATEPTRVFAKVLADSRQVPESSVAVGPSVRRR